MSEATADALIAHLWPKGDTLGGEQVYMVLDGARDPAIAPLVRSGRLEFACLYSGRLSPRLQAAAPYIVHLSAGSALTRELLARGWGNSWGFLTLGPPHLTLQQQRLHFKKLLRVRDEDGQVLNFRFYDPRVLRVFLPTCTPEQLEQFFGPVPRIVAEATQPDQLLDFQSGRDGLRQMSRPLLS